MTDLGLQEEQKPSLTPKQLRLKFLKFLYDNRHGKSLRLSQFDGLTEENRNVLRAEINYLNDNSLIEIMRRFPPDVLISRSFRISSYGIDFIEDMEEAFESVSNTQISASASTEMLNPDEVVLADDGNLFYKGTPFFELTELQRHLCRIVCNKPVHHNFKTIDVENEIYKGEVTKQRAERLKKLVERVNKIMKTKYEIPEFIKYGTDTIRRLA